MLQLIYACVESALQKLGLETAAAIIATLMRRDGMTVAGLVSDVLLLTTLVIALEKGVQIARQNSRIKWFILVEVAIGLGSITAVWFQNGADLNARIDQLVAQASGYLIFPWVFIFVLSPLLFLWLSLWETLQELGGSTIARTKQVAVFVVFFLLFWAFNIAPESHTEWPWQILLLATTIQAIAPTTAVLIAMAYSRRRRLRLAAIKNSRRVEEYGQLPLWQAPPKAWQLRSHSDGGRFRVWVRRHLWGSD